MSKPDETVRVVVRIRPMSSEEERNGNSVAAEAFEAQCMLTLKNPKASESEPVKQFTFDHVFGPNVTQKHIYDTCAFSMVESVLSGYNGTFFAYGQTGSGESSKSIEFYCYYNLVKHLSHSLYIFIYFLIK